MRRWDYTAARAYFITVCTQHRLELFGEINDGAMRLNDTGLIVADSWQWLARQYPHVSLDEWCVMADHLHGILMLNDPVTDVHAAATADDDPTKSAKPLGQLIGAFKTVSTKRVNLLRETPGTVLWQRDFWERIVRDEAELNATRRYIRNNPIAGSRTPTL